jgi:hypothetical protein
VSPLSTTYCTYCILRLRMGSESDSDSTRRLNWLDDQGGQVATFSDIQSSIASAYYPEGITSL